MLPTRPHQHTRVGIRRPVPGSFSVGERPMPVRCCVGRVYADLFSEASAQEKGECPLDVV